MTNALSASRIVSIDGCGKNCAMETLKQAGLPVSIHLCLTDHEMEKNETAVSLEIIEQVASHAAADLLEP